MAKARKQTKAEIQAKIDELKNAMKQAEQDEQTERAIGGIISKLLQDRDSEFLALLKKHADKASKKDRQIMAKNLGWEASETKPEVQEQPQQGQQDFLQTNHHQGG